MHAYRTSVHESTGYSPFRLMMGEECSPPQDVSTAELRTNREHDTLPHPFATWVRDTLEVTYSHVRESLHRTAACRKRLYDIKAVNRKFPVGSWMLRYYPPEAQHKLGSPWIGPNQVVRQATGHTVGIQKGPEKPIGTYWHSTAVNCDSSLRPGRYLFYMSGHFCQLELYACVPGHIRFSTRLHPGRLQTVPEPGTYIN